MLIIVLIQSTTLSGVHLLVIFRALKSVLLDVTIRGALAVIDGVNYSLIARHEYVATRSTRRSFIRDNRV